MKVLIIGNENLGKKALLSMNEMGYELEKLGEVSNDTSIEFKNFRTLLEENFPRDKKGNLLINPGSKYHK